MGFSNKPRLAVVGVGDFYRMVSPGIDMAFDTVVKVDKPDFEPKPGALRELVRGYSPDAVMILTPNRFHAEHVCEMMELKVPVFVEKPLVTTAVAMQQIEESVLVNPALYCSDFYVDVWGAQLLKWLGMETAKCLDPHMEFPPESLEAWNRGAKESLGDIVAVEATLLESVGPPASFTNREWLWDPIHGGVLWDMAYHHLAMWFTMVNEPLEIISVERSTIPGAPPSPSETYGAVEMRSTSGIRFSIKVGKYIVGGDDRAFRVTGTKGEISMDFVEPSRLMLGSAPLALLTGERLDYVAAVFREWVDSKPTKPYGLDAGRQSVNTMLKIREYH